MKIAAKIVLVVVLASLWLHGFGQIKGLIKDQKTGKPLSNVEVFINQSSIRTISDADGNFVLGVAPIGFVEVVLWKEGFELYKSMMRVQEGRAYNLNLTLAAVKKKRSTQMLMQTQSDRELGYRKYEWLDNGEPVARWYEEMGADSLRQTLEWQKKRKEIYRGSLTHLLSAVAAGKTVEESYEIRMDEEKVNVSGLVKPTGQPGYFRLVAEKPLEIWYGNTDADNGKERSELLATEGIDFNAGGSVLNGKKVRVTGGLATKRNRLPIDYVPIAGDVEEAYRETLLRFYEKVYVHTDKPYYYQGEPMWFKAYLSYYYPAWRDSLSKVLYVELISPRKEIIMEKILRIENGSAHGDFILPDTLKRGDYYLRAYTNLQRNFGDEDLYIKHIPILGITDKVHPTAATYDTSSNKHVNIFTNKNRYSTHDEIVLSIELSDASGQPIGGNLSISVTDISQVVPIASTFETLTLIKSSIARKMDFSIERDLSFKGNYMTKSGRPIESTINFVELKSGGLWNISTDENGKFELPELNFYDSTTIYYTELNKALEGIVSIIPRRKPKIYIKKPSPTDFQLIETDFPQRIFSTYEVPQNVRVLDEISIFGKRIESDNSVRTYGKSDYIISPRDLSLAYSNVAQAISGKIPGLQTFNYLDETGRERTGVRFSSASGLSVMGNTEPLVTINDVPVSGKAGEILEDIDLSIVESIEINSRINVLYGSQGVNGVISIYTKSGDSVKRLRQMNAPSVTLFGYSKAREFRYPSYTENRENSAADLRSTIYWNPLLNFTKANNQLKIDFSTADLPTQYLITIFGVLESGEHITASKVIPVDRQ